MANPTSIDPRKNVQPISVEESSQKNFQEIPQTQEGARYSHLETQGHRRMAPIISEKNYQILLKDPAFQKRTKEFPALLNYIESRASSKSTPEPLTRDLIKILKLLRSEVEDRGNLRKILRYELHVNRKFEKILEPSKGGRSLIPLPPKDKAANFAVKSQDGWVTFFKNVVNRGSKEQIVSRQAAVFSEAQFRGLFKEGALILVSDIKFQSDKMRTDKFARLAVTNPSLLTQLQKLTPGDKVTKDMLQQMGDEFEVTRLSHETEVPSQDGDKMLSTLKSTTNPVAQAQIEKSLVEERQRREADRRKTSTPTALDSTSNPNFFPWLRPDLPHPAGRSRFWLFLNYTLLAILGGVLFYALVNGLI